MSVHGDLQEPRFGLNAADFTALTHRIDAVIHSAAVTDFNRTDGSLEATNVEGTMRVLDLASAAGVPFYHISTAYLHATADGERGHTAVRYAASKRASEDLVRTSGLPHVILRPSVVVGDSRTGEVRSFQGLYRAVGAILDGVVPLIPFDRSWLLDFVPVDVVADAIATVVEHELTSGEFWITAGTRALRLDDAVGLCVRVGAEIGRVVDMPRFVCTLFRPRSAIRSSDCSISLRSISAQAQRFRAISRTWFGWVGGHCPTRGRRYRPVCGTGRRPPDARPPSP
jgi:thioester reductase-like protein